ncbi:MAG: endonuclease [Bacteroidales bacterium]|nr:endonuclease [Bacteroidales bacterium]
MKVFFTTTVLIFLFFTGIAQIPNGYYDGTDGLEGDDLRFELRSIITSGQQNNSYDDLYDYYEETDNFGSNKVWDMYSMDANGNASYYFYYGGNDECGQYSGEGDCYNREHSVPESWMGSGGSIADADLFVVIPTDGYVNNIRSNLPYGNNDGEDYTSTNGSQKGNCTYPGSGGVTCFEPIDVYKGDFARAYFYVVTRYNVSDWGGVSFSGDGFSSWTLAMLLEWDQADPVSQKEIDRNNAVYAIQHNRNPYIDHPEWVQCVFGDGCNTLQFTSSPVVEAVEDVLYTYNISYNTNSENETLTCTQKPDWLNFSANAANNTGVLSGTASSADIGTHSVELTLSEDGTIVTQNFTITVSAYQAIVSIFDIDFSSCLPSGWLTYSISSDEDWSCGSSELEVNAYGSSAACNDWFISPQIDLTSFNSAILSFDTWTQYTDNTISNPEVKLFYSTNYDGSGNPNSFSWTQLNYYYPQENSQSWTTSGNIDLSAILSAPAYIAFQYTSSGTGSATSTYWKLDNILLQAEATGIEDLNNDVDVLVFPNPTISVFTISSDNNIEDVQIIDVSGKIILTQSSVNEANVQIDLSNQQKGIYFIKINTKNSVVWRKIIKN